MITALAPFFTTCAFHTYRRQKNKKRGKKKYKYISWRCFWNNSFDIGLTSRPKLFLY